MSTFALVSSIVLSVASLAWGYAEVGWMSAVRWFIVFGAVWLFSQWRHWRWFSALGLFLVMLAAALGFWFEFNRGWMLAGAIFALFAWDMTDFRHRLHLLAADADTRDMERRHIARMSLLSLAALMLTSVALFVQVKFTFEWGIFLVIVILLGLMQLIAWFKKQ